MIGRLNHVAIAVPDLDAAAAQIERCGDVGEIRVQMIGRDAKCACQSFGVKFEVDLSSCKFAFGQKSI